MLEPARFRMAVAQEAVQDALARVAEGRVAEVVTERDRLRQVLVQSEGSSGAARDLGDLDRVRQARAEVVSLVGYEDLRLVLVTPEGSRVDDAVAVARVLCALVSRHRAGRPPGTLRPSALGGKDREALLLQPLEVLPGELGRRR